LLQGFLNCIPGVVVRGENAFLVKALFDVYRRLRTCHARASGPGTDLPQHPWYGVGGIDEEAGLRDLRALAATQLIGPDDARRAAVVGFKEIRWYEVLPSDAIEFLNFVEELFPPVTYVIHTRDLDEVARSGFWQREGRSRFVD
jgi:hypothetical protein